MIDIVKIEMKPNATRLGLVFVKYYDLVLSCDLCIYKNEKLWVRMPEIWLTSEIKKHFATWSDKAKSDEFQIVILKKVFDMIGLTLDDALKIRQEYYEKRKEVTTIKKKLTLKKNSEE